MLKRIGSLILCVISLNYIVVIDLSVLCVSVVRSTHCPKTVSCEYILPTKPKRAADFLFCYN
ncbi:MAG: hypothetical protein GPI93_16685 [Microcystis aeruginosa LG13-12]|nr:hypothetical protein [Microcystis aeruginosa LG13-12]